MTRSVCLGNEAFAKTRKGSVRPLPVSGRVRGGGWGARRVTFSERAPRPVPTPAFCNKPVIL